MIGSVYAKEWETSNINFNFASLEQEVPKRLNQVHRYVLRKSGVLRALKTFVSDSLRVTRRLLLGISPSQDGALF